MNVLDFFDVLHPGPTWRPWRVFVAVAYGEPLTDPADLALFRECTGRQRPRKGGYAEPVAIVGVQAGKTEVAATAAAFEALTGERGTHALMVAQDHRGSMRSLLRYAREPFETVDAFRAEVERATSDTLELRNGVSLSTYPCRPAALRGLRACVVVCDELGFFTTSDGRSTDAEMLRVARGRVATTGGKVIVISSPYAQTGALYELHRKHYGREDSTTLIWQASAPTMNPTLSADYLERMAQDDPDAYRSEVLGEFRAGLSTLLDPDALAAVVDTGTREREPVAGLQYVAHFDPSGGRADAAALAIAHRHDGRAVLDLCRAWPAPHNPAAVVAQAAAELRRYRVSRVQLDRFGGEYPAEQFRKHGIEAVVSPLSTSECYLELLPAVNAGAFVLLDSPELLRELRGLERRTGTAGKDRVDHRRGSHDDRAAAVAGALVLAGQRVRHLSLTWGRPENLRPAAGDAGESAPVARSYRTIGGVLIEEDMSDQYAADAAKSWRGLRRR